MPAPVAGISCANCAYYDQKEDTYGECRRYAPHPNSPSYVPKAEAVGQIKFDVHWPKVYGSNWCGQFASRQKAQQGDQ
ncbi:MAG: hypothetical protein ACYTEM_01230 [Planctomycetota bacterium]|jgi:hypothetical protein